MKKISAQVVVVVGVLVTVCLTSTGIGQENGKKILRINGAAIATDQVDKWAKQFMEKTPAMNIVVIGSSAGKGFQAFLDGMADIAVMSREIRLDERKKAEANGVQIADKPVGQAAVALITSPRNPVNEVTLDQLRKLYTGEYDNWKLVGGPDEPVRCLSRRIPESGAAVFFWEKVVGGQPSGSKIVFTETWDAIYKVCSAAPDIPIGIIPATRNLTGVKVLSIKQDDISPAVAPTEENIRGRKYPVILSFSLVWNDRSQEPAIKDFVDFCQKQGDGK